MIHHWHRYHLSSSEVASGGQCSFLISLFSVFSSFTIVLAITISTAVGTIATIAVATAIAVIAMSHLRPSSAVRVLKTVRAIVAISW